MNERAAVIARYVADRSRHHRDEVVAAYWYLCRRGARKFRRPESDAADLEQVAAIGLIKATDMYRAERTTPFEAYAWMMIVGELMHYARDHERIIRIPRSLRSLERRYIAAWERLAARHQAEPTTAELARELDVSHATIEELRVLRRAARSNDPDDRARTACSPDALPSKAATISLEERMTVIMAVEELPERERIIILGTFAAGLSQNEIALTLGLSQSQVSKLLGRALDKLHKRVA